MCLYAGRYRYSIYSPKNILTRGRLDASRRSGCHAEAIMDLTYIVIAAGAVLIAAIWLSAWKRIRPNAYHRRLRGQSKRAPKRMQSMTPGAMINYLRKMNKIDRAAGREKVG